MRHWLAISVAVCGFVATVHGALPAASAPGALPAAAGQSASLHRATAGHVAAAPGLYVVTLTDPPAASYRGGMPGYRPTRPDDSPRFDARRPSVRAYRAHLMAQQHDVLTTLGNPRTRYRYTTAVNGFAADLSSEQVKRLRTMSGVVTVQRSTTMRLSSTSPAAGPAPTAGAAWAATPPSEDAGEGVVIGVVDSGVWPENPSFDSVPIGARELDRRYPGFTGRCETGARWSPDLCDAKVLAARSFVAGFGPDKVAASEHLSPRDLTGHGSHTAAIAAGNTGVAVTIDDQAFGRISGVAPSAGLAVYKACWAAPDPRDDGCTVADTVAAVDQAVQDGVDVISYSIEDSGSSTDDVVAQAFLNAAESGVFVAAAAGNGGLEAGSIEHVSPWVTTVAASTRDFYGGRLTLGNGVVLSGAMVSTADVPRSALVYAGDVAAAGATSVDAARCLPGTIDAALVADAIVICDRGVTSRVDKSRSVLRSGAAGMVLANTGTGGLPADVHALPSLHVSSSDRERLLGYINAAARPMAALRSVGTIRVEAPRAAGFSSRGPSSVAGGDLLKPDLAAPGVNVLTAVAPSSTSNRRWDLVSGTSTSAPYVAGAAALLADKHPDWSPAATRSALMTTARPLSAANPFAGGAGAVQSADALDPGVVYDVDPLDWRRFADGRLKGRQLNAASIAVGRLVGTARVRRTLTNVGGRTETFSAELDGLPGLSTAVLPDRLSLAPGESGSFEVVISARRLARYGVFARGSLTWRGSRGHVATSPVVVRPDLVEAPNDVVAAATAGSTTFRARAGVTGTVRIGVVGPVAAQVEEFTLEPGEFDPVDPAVDSSCTRRVFAVPAATTVARFQVQAASPDDDLDLYVYRSGRLVAAATSSAADEQITLENPRPGRYAVYLNSASSGLDDATTSGTTTGWVLGDEDSGRLRVSPDPARVTGGRPVTLRASWPGLNLRRAWFGYIVYDDAPRRTYITLD